MTFNPTTPRREAVREAIKAEVEREERIAAYLFARLYRGRSHAGAVKELKPL